MNIPVTFIPNKIAVTRDTLISLLDLEGKSRAAQIATCYRFRNANSISPIKGTKNLYSLTQCEQAINGKAAR